MTAIIQYHVTLTYFVLIIVTTGNSTQDNDNLSGIVHMATAVAHCHLLTCLYVSVMHKVCIYLCKKENRVKCNGILLAKNIVYSEPPTNTYTVVNFTTPNGLSFEVI